MAIIKFLKNTAKKYCKTDNRKLCSITHNYALHENAGYKNVQLKLNVSESRISRPVKRNERANVIIIAGNLSPERGIFEFLSLFKNITYRFPGLELHLHCNIGDKRFSETLAQQVKLSNLQNNVMFQGVLPYPNLIKKLSTCLAAVMAFPTGKGLTNKIAMPNRFFDALGTLERL